MSDDLVAELGPLPRTHGMLGAMLADPRPFRTDDITQDPRFRGWWPDAHPLMRSFLGVPIVAKGDIIGAFYLTEKEGAASRLGTRPQSCCWPRTRHRRRPGQLFEDSRELALVGGHAAWPRRRRWPVAVRLRLAAGRAGSCRRPQRQPPARRGAVAGHQPQGCAGRRSAARRTGRDGLVATLRTQLTVAARAHGVPVELRVGDYRLATDVEHQMLDRRGRSQRAAPPGRYVEMRGTGRGRDAAAVRLRGGRRPGFVEAAPCGRAGWA
jgi:hypothetical protein